MTTVCTFKTSGLFVVDKKRLRARHVRQGNEDTLVHCYKLFGRWQDPAADEHTRLPFWERNVVTWGCFSAYVLQFRRCVCIFHHSFTTPCPYLPYPTNPPNRASFTFVWFGGLPWFLLLSCVLPFLPSLRRGASWAFLAEKSNTAAAPYRSWTLSAPSPRFCRWAVGLLLLLLSLFTDQHSCRPAQTVIPAAGEAEGLN